MFGDAGIADKIDLPSCGPARATSFISLDPRAQWPARCVARAFAARGRRHGHLLSGAAALAGMLRFLGYHPGDFPIAEAAAQRLWRCPSIPN